MRLILVAFTFFIFSSRSMAQKYETEYYDKYWQKVDNERSAEYHSVIRKIKDSLKVNLFLAEDYYKNDTLQMTGSYLDWDRKLKHGKFVYYYPNGKKKAEEFYIKNRLEGESKEYYESGQMKALRVFHNDTIINLKKWREDNSVSEMAKFKNGKFNGNYFSFYPNGKLVRLDTYDNGVFISGKCFTISGQDTLYFPHIIKPVFPLGYDKFIDYLRNGIQEKSLSCGWFNGKIYITATVDTNGKLIEPKLIYTSDKCYLKNIFELIDNCPTWAPAKIDGVISQYPINVSISFPK